MKGLIFSTAADFYADKLHAVAQSEFDAIDSIDAFERLNPADIEWLLAEPSLALSILPRLPNLRWLQSTWAGVELLVDAPMRHYTLTNIKGLFAPLMSEYVMAHCLAHERTIVAHHQARLARRWLNAPNGVVRGKTILILGAGSIGLGIAAAARFFGMRVLGLVHSPRPLDDLDEVGSFADLPRFLPLADYVVNVLPNTTQTHDLVDRSFLAQMKTSAVFINVGRGQAVVDADLVDALNNQTIAAAVLDVCRIEPLPLEHPFWHAPNLTLTSHTAAPSFPLEVFDIFIDNYQRFKRGLPLRNTVDFERGY